MRLIKFRALTKANNVMVFGDLIVCPNGEHRIIWFEEKDGLPLAEDYNDFNEAVQSRTIGQFTGSLDKNGIEIYEGDKCYFEIKGLGAENSECYFAHGCFFLKVKGQEEPFPLFNYEYRDDIIIEIIGNIHENPELL